MLGSFTKRCLTGLLIVACSSSAAFCDSIEEHQYLKETGKDKILFNWRLETGKQLRLITDLGEERDVTLMNNDLATRSWKIHDPAAQTDLLVRREGNRLAINGLFKGEKIERSEKIDASPWYQALSTSLRQFIDPQHDRLEFWSIRPDTLEVFRLQVSREGEELHNVNGIPTATIKLKIQLTGLKSMFWSCRYWLRKEDGLFVRYAGPSGPPGWPETTVELIPAPAEARTGEVSARPAQ